MGTTCYNRCFSLHPAIRLVDEPTARLVDGNPRSESLSMICQWYPPFCRCLPPKWQCAKFVGQYSTVSWIESPDPNPTQRSWKPHVVSWFNPTFSDQNGWPSQFFNDQCLFFNCNWFVHSVVSPLDPPSNMASWEVVSHLAWWFPGIFRIKHEFLCRDGPANEVRWNLIYHIPSGNDWHSSGKWPCLMSFPIQNYDFS